MVKNKVQVVSNIQDKNFFESYSLNVKEATVYDALIKARFKFNTDLGAQSLIFKWLLIQKAD